MILLTDGDVLVHNSNAADWWRLSPDGHGDYKLATWKGPYNMSTARGYVASGVLNDGRVFVFGGEYNGGQNAVDIGGGEIFDPTVTTGSPWSTINIPPTFNWIKGDAPSCVLPDGRVLLGDIFTTQTAIWDPSKPPGDTSSFIFAGTGFGIVPAPPGKLGTCGEETWTLLPEGTVLTINTSNVPNAEKYDPVTDRWIPAGNTAFGPASRLAIPSLPNPNVAGNPPVLVNEIGPAVVLPDGRLFAIGGNGLTGLYTQGANPTAAGSWIQGPSTPSDSENFDQADGAHLTVLDGPCVLLRSGKVLFVAGNTVPLGANFFSKNSLMFLFDPKVPVNSSSALTKFDPQDLVPGQDPSKPGTERYTYTFEENFLILPTGQVLHSWQAYGLSILTPDPTLDVPDSSWRPSISDFPDTLVPGHVYTISGTQFNGLSQACSYGDDGQMATNYPLVRIHDPIETSVYYLRTFNFSSMGIATGSIPQTANFFVPFNIPPANYELTLVVNGIESATIPITVVSRQITITTERDNISQGEIQAYIQANGSPAIVYSAIHVTIDGFTPTELGINAANLNSPPTEKMPLVTTHLGQDYDFRFVGPVIPQFSDLKNVPQSFLYTYDLSFKDDALFQLFHAITAFATVASPGPTSLTTQAQIKLTTNPNPFIIHGDSRNNFNWAYSIDLRVFQLKQNDLQFNTTVGTAGSASDIATSYIQSALSYLNSTPGSADPEFETLSIAEDGAQLGLAATDINNNPVYSFAIARVRLRDINPANDVRVFFRAFPGAMTMATFNPGTLFRTHTNLDGSKIPLLGIIGDEIVTVPFFAEPRIDSTTSSMMTQKDSHNVLTISGSGGNESHAYFGCWLDINQVVPRFPNRVLGGLPGTVPDGPFASTQPGGIISVNQLMRSQHQCLVAEIAFDPDPITFNADPSNTDKLAQRNLATVAVANPGLTTSRSAPQTFEVRPTPTVLAPTLRMDEIMIDWANIPTQATAILYWPSVAADTVLNLASRMYASHRFTKIDPHTLSFPANGLTYIPIPAGGDANIAGLLTIEFPLGIHKGQTFHLTVKQITYTAARIGNAPDVPKLLEEIGGRQPEVERNVVNQVSEHIRKIFSLSSSSLMTH